MSEERVSLKELALAEKARIGQPPLQQQVDDDPNVVGYMPPVATVNLPSLGKVYPASSPLYGARSLGVRAMTAREENILTSRPLLKKGTMLSTLMRACLTNKTVDPDQMLVGDRNAILIAIRVSAYGADYVVDVGCPKCQRESKATFNLAAFTTKELTVEPDADGSNVFSFELPTLKKVCRFRFLTGAEERELSAVQENMKTARGGSHEENMTTRLLAQIVSIGGETDRKRLAAMVPGLPAFDSRALRSYIDRVGPRVEMVQRFECPSCDEASEVDVPLGTEFFWPSS